MNIEKLMKSLPPAIITHIQHLERIRQDFVANVSHELRTPLTVILGYTELLLAQECDKNQTLKKILIQMQQQTARMENLIENLLFLSRLESSHEEENSFKHAVNVASMLANICHEARELSGELNHQIHLHADPELIIYGLENELYSLFSNIIVNAVKYTPAEGHIYVKWYSTQRHVYFLVRDTGIGIEAKHIPRITERFYRIDKARSRESGGTGLGLAIVKHVLIRHHGKLNIKSQLAKGSTFTCSFPKIKQLSS